MENTMMKVPTATNDITLSVFGSESSFESAQRMAKALSCSTIVPKMYQEKETKEALANCIIALEMANRIGESPLTVMQNLYVVHGTPAWSSKFLIAAINKSRRFSPLQYEQQNENTDKWRCRAFATDKSTGAIVYGAWVSIEMAKKEGWYSKSGSKWQTMPELMLQYRAAAFFQRVYAPEISMGMHTKEEVEDTVIDVPFVEVRDGATSKESLVFETIDQVNRALLRGQITKEEADELKAQFEQSKVAGDLTAMLDQ